MLVGNTDGQGGGQNPWDSKQNEDVGPIVKKSCRWPSPGPQGTKLSECPIPCSQHCLEPPSILKHVTQMQSMAGAASHQLCKAAHRHPGLWCKLDSGAKEVSKQAPLPLLGETTSLLCFSSSLDCKDLSVTALTLVFPSGYLAAAIS